MDDDRQMTGHWMSAYVSSIGLSCQYKKRKQHYSYYKVALHSLPFLCRLGCVPVRFYAFLNMNLFVFQTSM